MGFAYTSQTRAPGEVLKRSITASTSQTRASGGASAQLGQSYTLAGVGHQWRPHPTSRPAAPPGCVPTTTFDPLPEVQGVVPPGALSGTATIECAPSLCSAC